MVTVAAALARAFAGASEPSGAIGANDDNAGASAICVL